MYVCGYVGGWVGGWVGECVCVGVWMRECGVFELVSPMWMKVNTHRHV